MRKIVASIFMTLDGVVEDPGGAEGFDLGGWSFKYSGRSEEETTNAGDLLRASDALLLGRVTYQGFAKAWPSMAGGDWYADKMNAMPKYVVSSSLDKAEWNNSTIVTGDLTEEVAKLKSQAGQNLLVFGSGELVNGLLQQHLLDELRLLVYPVVLGHGKRLFREGPPVGLNVAGAKAFSSGVVLLTYHPAPAKA
jgi:dihydrofolate reductase